MFQTTGKKEKYLIRGTSKGKNEKCFLIRKTNNRQSNKNRIIFRKLYMLDKNTEQSFYT